MEEMEKNRSASRILWIDTFEKAERARWKVQWWGAGLIGVLRRRKAYSERYCSYKEEGKVAVLGHSGRGDTRGGNHNDNGEKKIAGNRKSQI